MEEIRIDATTQTAEELALAAEHAQLIFKFNHTMPGTAEYASRCQASFQFYIRATARGFYNLRKIHHLSLIAGCQ